MESEFAVESCVRGTTSTNLWERNCRVSGLVRKMSAARSLFLADQLLARYFSPISCLLAISGRSETEVL